MVLVRVMDNANEGPQDCLDGERFPSAGYWAKEGEQTVNFDGGRV